MTGIQAEGDRYNADNPRWLYVALASIGIHQVQSMLDEPAEQTFRTVNLALIAWLAVGAPPLPRRARGAVWMLLGVPPLLGALGGHLVPIARGQRVPMATETAPLNLAGAALLVALGAALVRQE